MNLDRDTLMNALNLEARRSTQSKALWTVGLVLGGAVVGAGIALLLAPKSGSELRKDLLREARDLTQAAKDGVAEVSRAVVDGASA
jgi:gas vesicle protein